jgi:transposase
MGNLVQERTRAVQWMQKALDQMNVQVHRAVTDLTGKAGLSILRSIVEGERDPQRLAQLRTAGCRKSEAEIAEFLTGTWRTEHLFNLEKALEMYDYLQQTLDSYEAKLLEEIRTLQPPERSEAEVPKHPRPSKESAFRRHGEDALRQDLWRFAGVDLTRIDGIGVPAATIVLTEVGLDLAPFPTENHFVSWLRLSPRTGFSAGKPVKKTRNALGATRISNALRMAALALRRSKSALGAYYRRIARRKGAAVAVFATARKLAILIYRMLRYGQDYVDIGEAAFEARFQERRFEGITAAAKQLGYQLVPIDAQTTPNTGSTG